MVIFFAGWQAWWRCCACRHLSCPRQCRCSRSPRRSRTAPARHTAATLLEVLAGLGSGVLFATILGYLLALNPARKRPAALSGGQPAIPTVAIAPLLVIWFGPGLFSKVLICALIVFFPVLVNTVVGLRSVPENLRDLMRSLRADRWQTFRLLELPAALPVLLGGLRIGATLSVIGAVVGELVGADRGLGFLINVGRGQYDTALVFVGVSRWRSWR